MQIIGRPKCVNYEKCGQEAIGLFGKFWVCGECMIKAKERQDKMTEGFVVEE